ncbi:hypothetical protein LINPERHAP1_LOCUS6193 [Linum perenne]
MAHDKLLTTVGRVRCHMSIEELCGYCGSERETITHVVRDCRFAKAVWLHMGLVNTRSANWNNALHPWMCKFLGSEHSILFGVVCWLLWKAWNARIFSAEQQTPLSVVIKSHIWTRSVKEALARDNMVLSSRERRTELMLPGIQDLKDA